AAGGGVRKLDAHATGIATTARTTPAITAVDTVKAPTPTPPGNEPNAMPTLAAAAGSDCANAPPGPARLTTRYCMDGAMPMAHPPMASTASPTSSAIVPKTYNASRHTATPMAPTT